MSDERSADIAAIFETSRPALFGMAYRMLGVRADAEDVVQDVYLRWSGADHDRIDNPAAWLMTVCTRRSIDLLRSSARSRVDYVGSWLPEPLAAAYGEVSSETDTTLQTAFLMLLERATARERAAFLLHDVFDVDFASIAEMLGEREAACRKLASRARRKIEEGRADFRIDLARQRQLLDAFEQAILTDDMKRLAEALAEDVRLEADGGGKAKTIEAPLERRAAVLAFLKDARTWWRAYQWREFDLQNGKSVALHDGTTIGTLIWFGVDDQGRIARIYIMRNPDKLRSITHEENLRGSAPAIRSAARPDQSHDGACE